jgi:hypothetical protein
MLFKDYHLAQIRAGEKTVTRREWADGYASPNVGSVVQASDAMYQSNADADCFIRITGRYEEPLGEVTDADAQKEGDYETRTEFIHGYVRVYGRDAWDPEKVVDVVEFEYVGRTPHGAPDAGTAEQGGEAA